MSLMRRGLWRCNRISLQTIISRHGVYNFKNLAAEGVPKRGKKKSEEEEVGGNLR